MSFKGPLFDKPVTGQELFIVVSYSKPALTDHCIPNTILILICITSAKGLDGRVGLETVNFCWHSVLILRFLRIEIQFRGWSPKFATGLNIIIISALYQFSDKIGLQILYSIHFSISKGFLIYLICGMNSSFQVVKHFNDNIFLFHFNASN